MEKTDLTNLHWFTSSFSASGACVEVAHLPGGAVAVRDSKDRGSVAHVYTRHAWEEFLAGTKNGEFDRPWPGRRRRPTRPPGTPGPGRPGAASS
jgi:hypothetical protein